MTTREQESAPYLRDIFRGAVTSPPKTNRKDGETWWGDNESRWVSWFWSRIQLISNINLQLAAKKSRDKHLYFDRSDISIRVDSQEKTEEIRG